MAECSSDWSPTPPDLSQHVDQQALDMFCTSLNQRVKAQDGLGQNGWGSKQCTGLAKLGFLSPERNLRVCVVAHAGLRLPMFPFCSATAPRPEGPKAPVRKVLAEHFDDNVLRNLIRRLSLASFYLNVQYQSNGKLGARPLKPCTSISMLPVIPQCMHASCIYASACIGPCMRLPSTLVPWHACILLVPLPTGHAVICMRPNAASNALPPTFAVSAVWQVCAVHAPCMAAAPAMSSATKKACPKCPALGHSFLHVRLLVFQPFKLCLAGRCAPSQEVCLWLWLPLSPGLQ